MRQQRKLFNGAKRVKEEEESQPTIRSGEVAVGDDTVSTSGSQHSVAVSISGSWHHGLNSGLNVY